MPYYHASRLVYHPGNVIAVPGGQSSYAYQLSVALGYEWREQALEAARNGRASNRQSAVFAANTPANAAYFLAAQPNPNNLPVHAYQVTFPDQNPCPMVLIGYIDRRGPDFAALPECIEEYWTLTENWQFLEYVVPSMTVVTDLGTIPNMDIWAATASYDADRVLAHTIWGVPPANHAGNE